MLFDLLSHVRSVSFLCRYAERAAVLAMTSDVR